MSKRCATSQPVDSPTAKRTAIDISYDVVGPFECELVNSIDIYTFQASNPQYGGSKSMVDEIYEDIIDLQEVDDWLPEMRDGCLAAQRNLYQYFENGKNELSTFNNALIRFQALAKGAMTRNRVVPAMLSADPTDLRQAVLFCANGYK